MILDGYFYKTFLEKKNYDEKQKECIQNVVHNLIKYETNTSKPISLLGKVQSGKTNTFIGILALAFDNDYDVSVILTKNSITLAEQTYTRLANEFEVFVEDEEMEIFDIIRLPELTEYQFHKKIIFIVKKEDDNLRRLETTFFDDYPILKEKNVLIIDDEADWASIGFTGNLANIELSKIAEQIKNFRSQLNHKSDFLQVTATPYSLYLQPDQSATSGYTMRPEYIEIMPTYPSYVGGIQYFEESESSNSLYSHVYQEVLEEELKVFETLNARYTNNALTHSKLYSFRNALVNFIVGAALRNLSEGRTIFRSIKYSYIIHIDINKRVHEWIKSLVDNLISSFMEEKEVFKNSVRISYEQLIPSFQKEHESIPELEKVIQYCIESLKHIRILKVNSDEEVKNHLDKKTGQLKLLNPLNIYIGAFVLDRGITIDNLISFYYGRNPKVFTQDTIMQHLRVYGNRQTKDMSITRLYTTNRIYSALKSTHHLDEEMRKAILENDFNRIIALFKDSTGNLKPTNPSKLKLSKIDTVKPRGRIVPTHFTVKQTKQNQENFERINQLLSDVNGNRDFENPFLVENDTIFSILDLIEKTFKFDEGEIFNFEILKHIIKITSREKNSFQSFLFVRENREISRLAPTGLRFINSPDADDIRDIAYQTAETLPLLMLLGQKGEKRKEIKMGIEEDIGWDDQPFFWPLLFTPRDMKTFIYEKNI
jgi:hypothetical protein